MSRYLKPAASHRRSCCSPAPSVLSLAACANENQSVADSSRLGSDYGTGSRYGRSGANGQTPGSNGDFQVNAGDIVYFSSDSSDLTPEAQQTLTNQSQWLQQFASADHHRRRSRRRTRHARIQHCARRPPRRKREAATSPPRASTRAACAPSPTARSARSRSATTSRAGRRTAARRPCSMAARRCRQPAVGLAVRGPDPVLFAQHELSSSGGRG